MSTFLVLPEGTVVGYSVWPHDPDYRPVVGLFDDMKLVDYAVCDLVRPSRARIPSRLLMRVARRVGLANRLVVPVALEGPSESYWFSLTPKPGLAERLRRRDPALRIARLADGVELTSVHAPPAAAIRGVERLLQLPDRTPAARLDGFPHLLQAPFEHQLEVAYLDVLGRAPDDHALRDYLPELEGGAWSLSDLVKTLLRSEEFRARHLTSNERMGAFMTSPLWASLASASVPGDPPRPAPLRASSLQASA